MYRYYHENTSKDVIIAKLEDAVSGLVQEVNRAKQKANELQEELDRRCNMSEVSVESLYEELDAVVEINKKLSRYIDAYGYCSGVCIGCGELKHANYICYHCGCDDSDEETFWNWVKKENKYDDDES